MVTLVGTQSSFHNALKDLAELDLDIIEAYKAAIERLENQDSKDKMYEFQKDHEQHVHEINKLLRNHGYEDVQEADGKQWLTKGKVILANIVGDDETILKAMLSNEEDTNKAYERTSKHENISADSIAFLQKGLADERKHKSWIEEKLHAYEQKRVM